ncbi:MAG TPA: ORF6N domain-containing protein [Hanamia sp.]
MQIIQTIQNRIYEIRGERVMIDMDLASLYEVETRVLNQSVKRNIKRFPKDFMFQLTKTEFENIKYQIETLKENMSSQIVMTSQSKRPKSALPYAFTEQGVAMLSGILTQVADDIQ